MNKSKKEVISTDSKGATKVNNIPLTDPTIAKYMASRKANPVPTKSSGKSFKTNLLVVVTDAIINMVGCASGFGKLPPQVIAMDRAFETVILSGKPTTLGNIADVWNTYPECMKQDFGIVWNHYSARLLGTASWDKENGRRDYALSIDPKGNGKLALFKAKITA
tara:strand:- start:198 stop:689 length:492 start_codon:yes stop_codon:yes gene_type:complete